MRKALYGILWFAAYLSLAIPIAMASKDGGPGLFILAILINTFWCMITSNVAIYLYEVRK